jgi:tetratricopeptide (TPR) repeat protein
MRRILLTGCGVLMLTGMSAQAQLPHFRAKVTLEDGSPPPSDMIVKADEAQRLVPDCIIFNVFGNGGIEYGVNIAARTSQTEVLARVEGALKSSDTCGVRITAKGYRQTDAVLHSDAVIVLKRIGDNEGSSTSMTEAEAPADARKAYQKGDAALAHHKFAEAQKDFERAIELYPNYAPAMAGLGEAMMEQQDPRDALPTLEKALQADPKYLRPYLELARLYINEGRMTDALAITDRAIVLNPVEFPGIFFYNAVANYNSHRYDQAEKSVRRAIELDAAQQIPMARHLLASVLAVKGDRKGAVDALQAYLKMSPNATDGDEVKQQIAELQGR